MYLIDEVSRGYKPLGLITLHVRIITCRGLDIVLARHPESETEERKEDEQDDELGAKTVTLYSM